MLWQLFVETEQVMLPRKAVSSCADTEILRIFMEAQNNEVKTESQPAHFGCWRSYLKHGDERASTVRPQFVHVHVSSLKMLNTFIIGTHLF